MRGWTIVGACALALSIASPGMAQTRPLPRMFGIKIVVQDFERSTRFYELLGLQAGRRHNDFEWELSWSEPDRGSAIVMVRQDAAPRVHVTPGGATLLFGVASVQETLARLRAAGFVIPGEPQVNPRYSIMMLQDPDGNWIELAGPGTGPAN